MRRTLGISASAALSALLLGALPSPVAAQLGIDLSDPQPARPAPASAPPAPAAPSSVPSRPPDRAAAPVEMDAISLDAAPAGSSPAQILAGPRKLLEAHKYEDAALALDAVLRQPALGDAHTEARVLLATALAALGLHRSALTTLDDAIATMPPGSPLAGQAAEALLDLADRTGDDQLVLRGVARLANATVPPAAQDRFQVLVAKASYERGAALQEAGRADDARRSFEEARRSAEGVRGKAGGAAPARARFVEGLVDYAEGNGSQALESFKDVVRLTNPRRGPGDPRLRDLAFLQLARLHYEHRQNRFAIFYYGKIPQDSDGWLEALWESSYAQYRIGDYERALGNLLTLHSPYFQDEWFPESYLLKAIIYYENCRYPEARAILEQLEQKFEPVHAALDRLASAEVAPASFYDKVVGAHGDADPRMALRLSRLALGDRDVRRLDAEIRAVRREAGRGLEVRSAAFRGSPLAKDLRVALDGERARLQTEAGARARHRLDTERASLRSLLEQALRVKVEVTRREREALEATLTKGHATSAIKDYRYSTAVSDQELYWPYDGEFWRDELGTYAYTLTKGCRAGPRDVQASR